MAGSALVLLLCSYCVLGGEVLHLYATQILPRSLQGEILDPYNLQSASAAALFHKLFVGEPSLNPLPFVNSPPLYSLLYPLWQLAILNPFFALVSADRSSESEKLEWAAWILVLLVLSPVPASYHFVVIIFPVVLLIDSLVKQKAHGWTALVVLLYSMISLAELLPHGQHGASAFLALARLWSELLLWAVCLRRLWLCRRPGETLRVAWLGLIATAGCIAAVFSYQRHFAYLQQDYARRLPLGTPSYLATSPRPIQRGYVYIRHDRERLSRARPGRFPDLA